MGNAIKVIINKQKTKILVDGVGDVKQSDILTNQEDKGRLDQRE